MDVWKYFEGKPELFAALVAAIAIVGGVVGAKMQANGGRAQAAAAREAAEIAAEAQRVATLWSVRQVQVAEFVQSVREAVRLSDRFYLEPDGGELQNRAHAAYQTASLKKAEIELIASRGVVNAAQAVLLSASEYSSAARSGGPTAYAELTLLRLIFDGEDQTARAASAANMALNAGSGMSYAPRLELLLAVPGLSEAQAHRLARDSNEPGRRDQTREDLTRDLDEKLTTFVDAARTMLKSEDDIAPAVPPQHRQWRRVA
ncbi:hypothetical protein [Streptomyces sp. NPDC048428]|uniref:hypothetical protein n=1 Tax=Streptomyces sp. NPDC048428 TaxID=3154503 RepID=UPI003438FED3